VKLSLRGRLLVSHILPIVLLVPLVGLALIYLLETRLVLPTLANEMIDQGLLVARLTKDHPEVWKTSSDAQALLDSVNFQRPTRIGMLTPEQLLLATSRPDDRSLVGKIIPNLPVGGQSDETPWAITPGDQPGEKILDVIVPVKGEDGHLVGLVRIYRRITDIEQNLYTMRILILGVLIVGLLLTAAIAVFLSESFSRSLKRLSQTIVDAPIEGKAEPLAEEGFDEFKALIHAFNRLQERRQELEENRRLMLANLVHEIGRPLGSLRTAVHALKSGAADDPSLRADFLTGMSERIDRMGRLIEDLALTYRPLTEQEIQIQPVNLTQWVYTLEPLWAENANQKNLAWECEVMGDMPEINTDPDRLAQALSNLVNNAFKFTPPGGKVALTIEQKPDHILLQVSDNGPGIPIDIQPHLFTPFYRGVQPPWKTPGLGLGLSITRSIVESLGGCVSFISIPDNGSIFTIDLPVR
jgi:two-component system, OmpR family, sensor histidine kinase BaeS